MKRTDIYLTEAQFFFLTSLTGTLSEHVRRACDAYMEKVKAQNVSASQSSRKEENG